MLRVQFLAVEDGSRGAGRSALTQGTEIGREVPQAIVLAKLGVFHVLPDRGVCKTFVLRGLISAAATAQSGQALKTVFRVLSCFLAYVQLRRKCTVVTEVMKVVDHVQRMSYF